MCRNKYENDLKDRIYQLRKLDENNHKGMTQKELAQKIDEFWGISSINNHEGKRSIVNKWESGKTIPTLQDCIAMSYIFDVSIDYLLGFTPFRKRDEMAISERTGLTEESLFILQELHNSRIHPNISDIINQLLSSKDGIQLLESLYNWNKQKEG